jgi:putative ABC transport system ATP-binding protein
MMPLIELEQVSKTFHPRQPDEMHAVIDVSLAVEPGAAVVLKGPSGSGKSTLLSLIGCMARPTSGRVMVAGRDVGRLPERFLTEVRRTSFGFIFQQFHLLPEVSVLENVLLPLYPLPLGLKAMRQRAEMQLERFGLAGKRTVRAGSLSGGEQQRVAIARALVNAPRILIADEPTAHLDRHSSLELLGLFAELNREGVTLLIATHDPLVHEHPLITHSFAMRDGRIEVRCDQ